jgi:hypothetical protein
MYDLYEPAYRARVPFPAFVPESTVRSRFTMTDVRIAGIDLERPDRALVRLEFMGLVPSIGRSFPQRLHETWIRVEGGWYKVYQPTTPPFPLRTYSPSPPSPLPSPP